MRNNSRDSGLAGKRDCWSCFSLWAFVADFIKALHQAFFFFFSICPILLTSLHKCSDISHAGYAGLPSLHLCRRTPRQANELSLFDQGLIHSRTLRKIQSSKSVVLTSHDSQGTKGCLCRHGPQRFSSVTWLRLHSILTGFPEPD